MSPSRQDHRMSLLHQGSRGDLTTSDEEGVELRDIGRYLNNTINDVIVLSECSFGWNASQPLVHHIDMSVKHGSFCMVIGPTGRGKSTLIKGILGETPCSAGFVYLATDSIAFADQDPWTINSTMRAGVCGESSFEEGFYQEVIDCCGLLEGLKILPNGDMNVVGSKGISLSGGQKSRLALAKVVFARKDVLVLDDVFSGIDADTEELIFRRLFSSTGLLRCCNTTVVLVTHAVARLGYTDWVAVLNQDGVLIEQGTYANLRKSSTYHANLDVRFKKAATQSADQVVEVKSSKTYTAKIPGEEGETASRLARKTSDWDTYKCYFTAAGWKSSLSLAVWSFAYVAAIKAPGLVIKYFSGSDKSTSNNSFMTILGAPAAVSLMCLALLVWQLFLNMVPHASKGLHEQLLHTVVGAPLTFFTETDSGVTINRFSSDLTLIDNELPSALIATILQLALFLVGGGLIAANATYALALIAVVIFVVFLVQRFYLRTSRQLRHLDLEKKAPLFTHFQETLAGLPSIRAFGWADQFCSKNFDLLDRSQRSACLLLCVQCWLGVVLDLLVAAIATILMVIIVLLRHKINPGQVGLGLVNIMSFNDSLSMLIKMWTLTETSIGAIARVRNFVTSTKSEQKSMESVQLPSEWPSSGAIEIRNFAASYSEESDTMLKGINLIIRPGERIGICGRSGSGKSSLLASLFHLLEVREGSVTIDGGDTAFIPRELLRRSLNAIPQEPFWIQTETVRFNLQPFPRAASSDAALIEVLRKCQIWNIVAGKVAWT